MQNPKSKLAQISKCRNLCNESVFLLLLAIGFFFFPSVPDSLSTHKLFTMMSKQMFWAIIYHQQGLHLSRYPLAVFPRYISDNVQHWSKIQNKLLYLQLYLWRPRQELDREYHWVQPKISHFYYLCLHTSWQSSKETNQEKLEKIGMKSKGFCLTYLLGVLTFKHIFSNYRDTLCKFGQIIKHLCASNSIYKTGWWQFAALWCGLQGRNFTLLSHQGCIIIQNKQRKDLN